MTARCPGCGGLFPTGDGPRHPYMLGSPGCWARYGVVLAREYADPVLMAVHRLSVDAYAVQHPGRVDERRAVQSVWLHLGRLSLQLGGRTVPRDTHAAMGKLNAGKATLPPLDPPTAFALTAADLPLTGEPAAHIAAVTAWADAAWQAWTPHHDAVRRFVATALG